MSGAQGNMMKVFKAGEASVITEAMAFLHHVDLTIGQG